MLETEFVILSLSEGSPTPVAAMPLRGILTEHSTKNVDTLR